MATRLVSVNFDAHDHAALARWWADALGWSIVYEADDEVEVSSGIDGVPTLEFIAVPEPKVVKNRIHLDLASRDDGHMAEIVDRLLASGATRVDVGQAGAPWVVLADPEGNEFCVLEPRERTQRAPGLASIVVDAHDPAALAAFWAEVAGWAVANVDPEGRFASLHRPDDRPPDLDFVRVDDPKVVKNRVHLDVAPRPDDDRVAIIGRLHARGAADADVGQGPDVSWHVLTDPEGNEFCVLSNR
ncbi:MAG TPA: VOC family protein [Candidatus Binatia bacterium]|nr:VOC family protein [Candidatus Binatia bacterium]